MNSELCSIQNKVVAEENYSDRICILEGDIQKFAEELGDADVVILNNVFDWFLPAEEQEEVWNFLCRSLKKDCLLVTIPSLSESLSPLNTNIDLKKWVSVVQKYTPGQDQVETSEIYLYKVLNQ